MSIMGVEGAIHLILEEISKRVQEHCKRVARWEGKYKAVRRGDTGHIRCMEPGLAMWSVSLLRTPIVDHVHVVQACPQ